MTPVFLLSQQLQVAPPTGVCERDRQQHRKFAGAGRQREVDAGVHASLLQRQGFPLSGEILQHAGVMEPQLLQGVPEGGGGGRGMRVSRLNFLLCLIYDF